LELYPTTLEEDLKILKSDKIEDSLGVIKKNCMLYRRGEKAVLNFLKDCAEKVEKLGGMTEKEARSEVSSWEYLKEGCKEYFQDVFCPLLHKNNAKT